MDALVPGLCLSVQWVGIQSPYTGFEILALRFMHVCPFSGQSASGINLVCAHLK